MGRRWVFGWRVGDLVSDWTPRRRKVWRRWRCISAGKGTGFFGFQAGRMLGKSCFAGSGGRIMWPLVRGKPSLRPPRSAPRKKRGSGECVKLSKNCLRLSWPVELVCQQHNASVIQIVHGGYSPKLRRMKKVHKLNLSSLYEVFEDPMVKLQYIQTALQHADPFTKALEPCKWSNALELMSIKPPWASSCTAPTLQSSCAMREGGEE